METKKRRYRVATGEEAERKARREFPEAYEITIDCQLRDGQWVVTIYEKAP